MFLSTLQESDWSVLQCVLESLPSLLQNKTIVSAASPRDVEKICIRLCKLVSEHFHNQLIAGLTEFRHIALVNFCNNCEFIFHKCFDAVLC